VKVLGDGPAARSGRPASELVHDEPNVRIVCFHLLEGQCIPAHASDSTVVVEVIGGGGVFRGADHAAELEAGASAVFAPGELRAIEAVDFGPRDRASHLGRWRNRAVARAGCAAPSVRPARCGRSKGGCEPLDGRIRFTKDDGRWDLGPGDLLASRAGVRHSVASEGGASFLLTVALAGDRDSKG
jgi:quercetin dioxygenase-like cupin family protein